MTGASPGLALALVDGRVAAAPPAAATRRRVGRRRPGTVAWRDRRRRRSRSAQRGSRRRDEGRGDWQSQVQELFGHVRERHRQRGCQAYMKELALNRDGGVLQHDDGPSAVEPLQSIQANSIR